MSRRTTTTADRAEANRATLKALVKVESNKSCADCKRNKHPRWASWNLGIFICIRCSGIHRGMGTHISKVKSVDLDSWTDEQLQSMIKWGNARANKYWESKLAPGHVPSESKIENFIRTKYDSKRWVMDGGMPDPSTLGSEDDDDVPLQVVQDKTKIERASSANASSSGVTAFRAPARPQPQMDLMGGGDGPQRPSTTEPISRQPPAKGPVAPPKQTRPNDSLLGLDFLGGSQSTPSQQAQGAAAPSVTAAPRTDLKQSILSLYASAPRSAATPTQPQHQHSSSGSFGNLQSAGSQSSNPHSTANLNDAFSSLNFSTQPTQTSKPDPFGGLESAPRSQVPTSSFGGGGSFFDPPSSKPSVNPQQAGHAQSTLSQSSGFGDFFSAASPSATAPPPTPPKNNVKSVGGDLFDLSMSSQVPPSVPKPASDISAAFNLSNPTPSTASTKAQASLPTSNIGSADPWGSNDVWGTSQVQAQPSAAPKAPVASNGLTNDFGGWGNVPKAAPKVTQDDDFGGWNDAVVPAAAPKASVAPAAAPAKPSGGGFSGNSDPFENPWG